jgi:hypothetical protein
VIDGELGERFASLFEGLELRRDGGTTVLTGFMTDQAQLFGVINRVQDVGLVLLSVEQLDPPPGPDTAP